MIFCTKIPISVLIFVYTYTHIHSHNPHFFCSFWFPLQFVSFFSAMHKLILLSIPNMTKYRSYINSNNVQTSMEQHRILMSIIHIYETDKDKTEKSHQTAHMLENKTKKIWGKSKNICLYKCTEMILLCYIQYLMYVQWRTQRVGHVNGTKQNATQMTLCHLCRKWLFV